MLAASIRTYVIRKCVSCIVYNVHMLRLPLPLDPNSMNMWVFFVDDVPWLYQFVQTNDYNLKVV